MPRVPLKHRKSFFGVSALAVWELAGKVTSRVLCHKERGSNSLLFVFIGEHRIEDPVHTGSV